MPGFMDNWGQSTGSPTSSLMSMDPSGFGAMSAWGMPADINATQSAMNPMGAVSSLGKIQAPGIGGSSLGLNMPTANLALSGLSTIGNLWAAFQAQKLAKEQFNYTKGVTNTNLANQIQTYNTGITDRANNRAIVEGRSPADTKAYIDTNSLKKFGY